MMDLTKMLEKKNKKFFDNAIIAVLERELYRDPTHKEVIEYEINVSQWNFVDYIRNNDLRGKKFVAITKRGIIRRYAYKYLEKISGMELIKFIQENEDKIKKEYFGENIGLRDEHQNIISDIKKLDSRLEQLLPLDTTPLERKLILAIHKKKDFTSDEILEFSKLGYNRNSIYNRLKIMEKKGLLSNKGHGYVNYHLTDLGEVFAKFFIHEEKL